MADYSYAIATGHNVSLGSLTNFEDIPELAFGGRNLPPRSQPVDTFPVRTLLMNGRVRGDGMINQVLTWDVLPVLGLKALIDDYLTTGGAVVVSKPCTLYTRLHDLDTYKRYNAYIVYPQPNEDYNYDRTYVFNLNLQFTDLQVLA